MKRGIDYLTERQMKIVKMTALGRSPASIASQLGITVGTVYRSLRKPLCKQTVRKFMQETLIDRIESIEV